MYHSKYWVPVSLSTSHRPIFENLEHDIAVQDGVGLYQGSAKLLQYQNGRVYLTNKRIIYVPEAMVSNSHKTVAIALRLSVMQRCIFHPGFLTSSPKVEIVLRSSGVINSSNKFSDQSKI